MVKYVLSILCSQLTGGSTWRRFAGPAPGMSAGALLLAPLRCKILRTLLAGKGLLRIVLGLSVHMVFMKGHYKFHCTFSWPVLNWLTSTCCLKAVFDCYRIDKENVQHKVKHLQLTRVSGSCHRSGEYKVFNTTQSLVHNEVNRTPGRSGLQWTLFSGCMLSVR